MINLTSPSQGFEIRNHAYDLTFSQMISENDSRRVQSMPLSDRDFNNILSSQPTLQLSSQTGNQQQSQIHYFE